MNLEPATDPADTVIAESSARIQAMADKFADFSRRWRSWAHMNQSNFKLCEAHAFERSVNEEKSIRESWHRQEFVIFYKTCVHCLRLKNKPKNKAK